jgi:predicted O-methyltransferase YrrM
MLSHPQRRIQDFWRVFRAGFYLLKRPQDFIPYFQYGLLCGKTPLELGMPWWSFGSVREVEKIIRKNMKVFEFGSGGSTIFLAERAAAVTFVEDEEGWAAAVRKEAQKRNLNNLEVLVRPYDFFEGREFEASAYLNSLQEKSYDLIVVDGKEEGVQVRDRCFWRAEAFIRKGGVIVVDDSYRYPQIKKTNKSKRWKAFKGAGYCRAGVTETTVFYF